MSNLNLDQPRALLIGSYTDLDALAHQPYAPVPGAGVYTMRLETDGTLSQVTTEEVLNPAVLIPGRGDNLYAILETIRENGTVVRYRVGAEGKLEEQERFEASGKSTCYLALSPDADTAVVINYWDATIDVVDVDPEGRLGAVRQSFVQFHRPEGTWRQVENREDHWGNRQVGPHAHCAHFWDQWVFIPDLGENAVFQYRWNPTERKLERETWIDFEAGSGPRHMAMHPDLDVCYVSNELFNTVCAANLDRSDPDEVKPRLVPFQYESTLDNRDQVSYVSEIKLSADARFLYVSNRGDNSLACFAVDPADGSLTRTAVTPTGGKFPRHFAISPDGKAVLVANQDSGHVRVFGRDVESGALTDTGQVVDVPAPNYIRFL
jgi:6-phosphogluconolactonase